MSATSEEPKRQPAPALSEDEQTLRRLGYQQELSRRMTPFSNFAISVSIICILAGGITSFQYGFCSVGGASIGLGWPLVCLFSMTVALSMAQVASAFPTAGGLYHWAAILGGKGWGWITAWCNLVGLITVVAAVNAGTYDFLFGAFPWQTAGHPAAIKLAVVAALTLSQAYLNHRGIRLTTMLTDFCGYLILVTASVLTLAMLWRAPHLDFSRLLTFANYSGLPADDPVLPHSNSLLWLFALGFLLPAYTITGFDASAHTAEETMSASVSAPRGIVRSVAVSAVFGWLMLSAIVLAIPNFDKAAAQGNNVLYWVMNTVLPRPLALLLYLNIGLTQYLCGLAGLTSASRMMYAFARDGGLPGSVWLRRVSTGLRAPATAVWTAAFLALLFMAFVPYSAIAACCAVFLYISYVLPIAAGFLAYGRTWTKMGPWCLGRWYRPLAVISVIGCLGLIVIGVQPPNQIALKILGGAAAVMAIAWFAFERNRFQGPPQITEL
ncbi:MAG TPA: amino acid permease [Candidatus Binatia bacterium]|jgi:amino acid transporter|nr:amino acid permease [Candidatus Binatia bacterium]